MAVKELDLQALIEQVSGAVNAALNPESAEMPMPDAAEPVESDGEPDGDEGPHVEIEINIGGIVNDDIGGEDDDEDENGEDGEDEEDEYCVCYIYPDNVIVMRRDNPAELWRIPYTVDAAGQVQLGAPEAVQMEFTPAKGWLWARDYRDPSGRVAIKSITKSTVTVAGYGVIFGGRDLEGETFTRDTNYMLDLVPVKPVL